MAQRVYQALPNIPYMGSSGVTGGVPKADPNKVTGDAQKQARSYTEYAASYLPKNMPSMPSMPNMPNIPGYSGKQKDTSSKTAQATKDAGETAKNASNAATETVGTTVKNVANINDNPATKQVKQAPGVKQALDKDPGVSQTVGKGTEAVGTTVSNATDQVTGALGGITEHAGQAGSQATDAADTGAKKAAATGKTVAGSADSEKQKEESKEGQTYTSYAASYLPSMPSFGRSKKAAPKLDRKDSSQAKESAAAKTPKLERKGSSNVAGAKSPPPKLGARKASEPGAKSPLQRMQSGSGTSQLPNIGEKLPSSDSVKEAGAAPQAATTKGVDTAGQVASKGQEAVNTGTNTVTGAASGVAEKVPGGGTASSAVSQGTGAAGQAATMGKDAVTDGAKTASDTAGQAASRGQQAVSQGASATTGAVGSAFGSGKKMLGFGR